MSERAPRTQRLVFGEDPELYDRVRPSYPDELFDDVAALVPPGGRVIDVGCGTGKAAVPLARRVPNGVGIEADPGMAAIAVRNLHGFPGWRVDISDFEEWRPDQPADVLTSAQAWHWIRPDARDECAHAALTDGGWIALWWNRTGRAQLPFRDQLDGVYERFAPAMRNPTYGPADRPMLTSIRGFGSLDIRDYAWTRRYTTSAWVDLMRTSSDHRLLPAGRREPLLGAVAAVIDANGGEFDHPYQATLILARRQAGSSR